MTVSSTTNAAQFTGNGVTTAFAFPYPFFATSDLVVTLYDTTLAATVSPAPVLNGGATYDYTVAGTFDTTIGEFTGGATVTFTTAPPANYQITIKRAVPQTQPNAYTNNGPFPAKSVEGALDRSIMQAQQLTFSLTRTLLAPDADPIAQSLVLPVAASRANKFLGFDASGLPVMAAGTSGGVPVTAAGARLIAANPFQQQNKAGNYVVALTDHASMLNFTGATASTFTLLAPATALNDWINGVRNSGTARLTVTPASGLIDGQASIIAEIGEAFWIVTDGTNYVTIGRGTGPKLIQSITFAAAASVAFTLGIDGTYRNYELRGDSIQPSVNGADLSARLSEDGGASWKQGAGAYNTLRHYVNSAAATAGAAPNDTKFQIASNVGNAANLGVDFNLVLARPSTATRYKNFYGLEMHQQQADSFFYLSRIGGQYIGDTGAVNGVQFFPASGTISGTISLWGCP